ncbi:MAG: TetR/AcrR family transcriptional regulator [Alcanivorax sp.]|nr:TetR/AcrR family transcriptional regulator [Alcanivorax sp.]
MQHQRSACGDRAGTLGRAAGGELIMASTKDRILETSLDLFNRRGERNVTTNHIAEALGISPGNLYYHFRNKSVIVAALFGRYEEQFLALLAAPQGPLTWRDKVHYFEGILASLWQHRFFHRDLGHFLNQDDELNGRYRTFVSTVFERGLVIYRELRASGILEMDDEQLSGLMVNTWVLVSSWAGMVHGLYPQAGEDEALDEKLIRQGMYQLICLEEPFLRGEAREHLAEMQARYRMGDSLALLLGNQPGLARTGS